MGWLAFNKVDLYASLGRVRWPGPIGVEFVGWLAFNKVDLYASFGNLASWRDLSNNSWSSWQRSSTRDSGFLMVLGGRQLSSGLDDLVWSLQR